MKTQRKVVVVFSVFAMRSSYCVQCPTGLPAKLKAMAAHCGAPGM